MSTLLEIAEKLQDTQTALAKLENAIVKYPDEKGLGISLLSLRKRQKDLEGQFAEAANKQWVDVCSYRLFREEDIAERPTLYAFSKTLLDFQSLVTLVYSAIKEDTPRQTTKVGAEALSATTFGFGYTFAGSLGVVLTMPNERLLIGDTDIDKTIETVFELVKTQKTETVAEFAKRLGAAPIRTLYNWVSDQVTCGVASQIEWWRGHKVKTSVLTQLPELATLKQAIEQSSDEKINTFTTRALLVGADTKTRAFHLVMEREAEIRGKMADTISAVELPKWYTAKIQKTTRIFYSTEKESVNYVLLSLE